MRSGYDSLLAAVFIEFRSTIRITGDLELLRPIDDLLSTRPAVHPE
jgi:hypothetical protein